MAVLEDSEESIVILLENGADILTKDFDGISPLMMCDSNKRLRSLILENDSNKKEDEEESESSEKKQESEVSKTLSLKGRKTSSVTNNKKDSTLKRTLSKQSRSRIVKNSSEHELKIKTCGDLSSSVSTKEKVKKSKMSRARKLQKTNETSTSTTTTTTINEIDEEVKLQSVDKSEKWLKRVYSYNEKHRHLIIKDYNNSSSDEHHHQNSAEIFHDSLPYYDDEGDEENLFYTEQYREFSFDNRNDAGTSTGKSEEDDDSVTHIFRQAFSSLIDHDSIEETSRRRRSEDDNSSPNSDTVFY